MGRLACLIAIVCGAATSHADSPPSLADLVRQLGNPKFAIREVAHKAILQRGERVIAELDELPSPTDPETLERLKKIRNALVAYKDEIRELLPAMQSYGALGETLRHLIVDHQPGSINFLLSIAADAKNPLRGYAAQAFAASKEVATVEQVETFIQQILVVRSNCRPRLPAIAGVHIPVEVRLLEGLSIWFPDEKFDYRSKTTCYVDGKALGKAYQHLYAYSSISRHPVRDIAVGKHTFHAVLDYEFTHRGLKRSGKIVSEDRPIEILPPETVDDLAAPKSVDTANLVRAALLVEGVPVDPDSKNPEKKVQSKRFPSVEPQVTVILQAGKLVSVVCPQWRVRAFLPVDLCFEVEFRDIQSGKAHEAGRLYVPRRATTGSYLFPKHEKAFFIGLEGLVPMEIILKPSRLMALENPSVTRYFAEEINVGVRYFKIVPTK